MKARTRKKLGKIAVCNHLAGYDTEIGFCSMKQHDVYFDRNGNGECDFCKCYVVSKSIIKFLREMKNCYIKNNYSYETKLSND